MFQTREIDYNYTKDGDIAVSFTVSKSEKNAFESFFKGLKKDKVYDVEIKKHQNKRSQNANKYMWILCQKIADKLTEEQGVTHTKEDVYRCSIREIGVYRDAEFDEKTARTFRTAWERLGTGWITETVDYIGDGDITVRFYYGSSTYNTRQMSKLINNLTEECRELDIETVSPEEMKSMLESWGHLK